MSTRSPRPRPTPSRDEDELEELLSRPSAADVGVRARRSTGDVVVLGAGGKMGPSLARRVRRALRRGRRAAARRSPSPASPSPAVAAALERDGIETIAVRPARPGAGRAPARRPERPLPRRPKFGSSGRPDLTWAQNVVVPVDRGAALRGTAGSSCSRAGTSTRSCRPAPPGSTETDPVGPVGEYAQTCVGRERVFEHASRERGTPCLLFRLFYAVDLRYGTLVDVARKVHAGEPVDLRVGHVNALWQGDANSYAFRALALCETPPAAARRDGARGACPCARVAEALRPSASAARARFAGDARPRPPRRPVSLRLAPRPARGRRSTRLVDWVADWVARGGRSLGKPTHFEATDGRF